ncbi:hypothetical protein Ancab_030952 [Ancistrocladus abbreviatus]
MLSGPVGNVFTGLHNLKEMDLSHNKFMGDLPSSFATLRNLTKLFLQNNSFTGSVIFLADLQLTDLNIQDNNFSGIIPEHFKTVPNLWIGGNKFYGEANYPPWEFPFDNVPREQNITSPPTSESNAIATHPPPKVHRHKTKGLGPGGITLMVGGVAILTAFAALIMAIQINLARKKLESIVGSPISMYSVPATSIRDYSSGAPDESPQILDIDSPPKMPGRLPLSHHITQDRTSRRSLSRKFKMPPSAKLYSVAEVQLATNNFSEANFLGEGSLGSVYKAEFPDGQLCAVKDINTVSLSLHEEEQFMDVIRHASRLRHPNIVQLTGYCVEQGKHILLYEYVPNLSLEDALYREYFAPLTWGLRLQIAVGVARALNCMHSLSPPIAHCNLKASNILLDDELLPRLSDCGLAILRPLTSNSVKLKASEMAITNSGYIAPEHGQPGVESTKTDVYAFGVLLLELLTGRRPFDSSRPREEQSLENWASSRLHDADALELMVDPSINRSFSTRALSRFADVVSLCIQPEKEFRPSISEIVEALTCLLPKPGMDGSESTDPFEKSFLSTYSRFAGSPTVSFVHLKSPSVDKHGI